MTGKILNAISLLCRETENSALPILNRNKLNFVIRHISYSCFFIYIHMCIYIPYKQFFGKVNAMDLLERLKFREKLSRKGCT